MISVTDGLVVIVIEWLVFGEGGGFHLNDLGTWITLHTPVQGISYIYLYLFFTSQSKKMVQPEVFLLISEY